MRRTGPPELMPATMAAEMPNQEFVREKLTPKTDQTEKLRWRPWVYPISASLRASVSTYSLFEVGSDPRNVVGVFLFSLAMVLARETGEMAFST